MTKSYRLKTQVNSQASDQSLRVNIDQDFDFLEILSLKLTQSDVYRRFCSDYGVIAGRVVANGGFGIPNARVSVFIPIDNADLTNPVINTLYPYKSPTEKNEDGYRYNLLPYEPSYEGHVATGTFPSKEDVLTRKEVLEIYEKYYKFTVRTNDSGDYMIVGVPTGDQKIVVDVDLSDIGCFSLRPTDLIRMNRANKQQFDGNNFKSSTDLNSLPQLVNLVRNVNIGSFWGEGDECNIGITRVDFDLRDQNINIEPTAVFMGSIFSSNDEDYLKNNCKPKSEQGDLCGLVTGPGTLLAVRQTVNLDQFGRPILEQYSLPSGGKVIDDNGAFIVDVPMNLDYLITDEYGNLVVSQDPKVGIPSKGKYRFKVKYNSSEKDIASFPNATQVIGQNFLNLNAFAPKGNVLRGNFLLPNIKEYGWDGGVDPAIKTTSKEISHVYAPGGNIKETWSVPTSPRKSYRILSTTDLNSIQITIGGVVDNSKWIDNPLGLPIEITVIKNTEIKNINGVDVEIPKSVEIKLVEYDYDYVQFQKSYSFSVDWDDYPNFQDAVKCEDTFYQFNYNKVYTTAQLIDEYRKGTNRSRFLTIKEVLERSCQTEVNKFPVNDGVRNFDLLYFIISILLTILSPVMVILIIVYDLVKFLWNNFVVILAGFFIAYSIYRVSTSAIVIAGMINVGGPVIGAILREGLEALVWGSLGAVVGVLFKKITAFRFGSFRLPMITYPDCSACDCGEISIQQGPANGEFNTSPLADVNIPTVYQPYSSDSSYAKQLINQGYGQVAAGRDDRDDDLDYSESRTPRFTFRNNEYWDSNKSDVKLPGRNKDDCDSIPESYTLPIPERINLYNTKGHYYNYTPGGGSNRIKIFPNYEINKGTNDFYEDQPLVVLCDPGFLQTYSAGTMLSFVSASRTKDVNLSASTKNKNALGTNNVTGTTPSSSSIVVNINYADPDNPNNLTPITKSFTVNQTLYTSGVTSYNFPADIEYYQVVTGYTLSDVETLVAQKTHSGIFDTSSFYRRVIKGRMNIGYGFRDEQDDQYIFYSRCSSTNDGLTTDKKIYPVDTIPADIRNNLVVVILMKGVDPYSQRQKTKIDISRIFGFNEGSLISESNYKLNIPIQPNLTLGNYSDYTTNNTSQNIFYPSYYFTPSPQTSEKEWRYSAFTTTNHNLYDSFNGSMPSNNQLITGTDGYYPNEYINGAGYMYRQSETIDVGKNAKGKNGDPRDVGRTNYARSVYDPTGKTLTTISNVNIVMRTDRLPRSDKFDNNFVLAQNKNFAVYSVPDTGYADLPLGAVSSFDDFSTGQAVDFAQAYGTGTTSTLSTFSCEKMVPIGAYTQSQGQTMQLLPPESDVYWVDPDTKLNKRVVNGCYQFAVEDLKFGADLRNFAEWKSRFLIGLAICRNVFGLTFTNQWLNGGLYMPGFQNDKIYENPLDVSNPTYIYCKDKLVFRIENNSFFYRSSPYNSFIGFVGMPSGDDEKEFGNQYFLGNPTTITDLGPKDNIIKNICAQPEFQGYYAGRLTQTSYNSVGDLLQLFIISRLSNADWLNRVLGSGNASVGEFFSRRGQKIDGDYAQMSSINSEFGVVPFSPEGYSDSNLYYRTSQSPTIGVFFSASTTDRDFVSPGRETFIDTVDKFGYNQFGRKSQQVPMYKWKRAGSSAIILAKLKTTPKYKSIFGTESNDWYTDRINGTFYSTYYQNIDRLKDDTYFASPQKLPTNQRPGYIYASTPAKDSNGKITGFTYDANVSVSTPDTFLVGAPYHFYFGLKIGKTALDKFIQDYAIEI